MYATRLVARVYGTNRYNKIRHFRPFSVCAAFSSAQQHCRNFLMRSGHPHMSPVCPPRVYLTSPSPPQEEIARPARPPPPRTPPRSRRWPPSSRGHHWPRRPRAAHAPHGPPRPSPTHHTLWSCPGWPGYARVGRRWPVAASPCSDGNCSVAQRNSRTRPLDEIKMARMFCPRDRGGSVEHCM